MGPEILAQRPPSGPPSGGLRVGRAAVVRQLSFPKSDSVPSHPSHQTHPPPLFRDEGDEHAAGPPIKRQRSDVSVQLQLTAQLQQAQGQDHGTPSASGTSTGIPNAASAPALSTLDDLPDELLCMVLGFAAEGSDTPADFINMLMASRRFCVLGGRGEVLKRLPLSALKVSAVSWSDAAMRFLSRCAQAGNADTAYALGMIAFYCLGRPGWGLRLLSQAALARHAGALYSLAVIHFNGSGGAKEHRDVAAGVLLCMQAAALGHLDATRELGHCLQDGFGVQRDPAHGRRLLIRANAQERAQAIKWGAAPVGAPGAACCSGSGHTTGSGDGNAATSTDAGFVRSLPPDARAAPTATQQQQQRVRCTSVLPLKRSQSAPPCTLSSMAQQVQTARALRLHFSGRPQRREPRPTPGITLAQSEEPGTPSGGPSMGPPLAVAPFRIDVCSRGGPSAAEPSEAPESRGESGESGERRCPVEGTQTTGVVPSGAFEAHWLTGAQNGVPQAGGGEGSQQRSGRGASAQERQGGQRQHQCFCLPTVTLPLYALSDGWLRLFLLDWHSLEEVGLIEHSAPAIPIASAPANSIPGSPEVGLGSPGVRMPCNNMQCGRVELRPNEFRCCSACTEARYCSRVCQAQDWKTGHKKVCARIAQWRAIVDN